MLSSRTDRKRLDELVSSIEAVGVLVPLVVRALGAGARKKDAPEEYSVIAGAGRLEALRRTGAKPGTPVPCVVVAVDDAEATLLSLVENTVREPMRAFDEAETARVLVEEYGYTQERVAKALGMTQGTVSRQLGVFELDASVIAALRKGQIEMGVARALCAAEIRGEHGMAPLLRRRSDRDPLRGGREIHLDTFLVHCRSGADLWHGSFSHIGRGSRIVDSRGGRGRVAARQLSDQERVP